VNQSLILKPRTTIAVAVAVEVDVVVVALTKKVANKPPPKQLNLPWLMMTQRLPLHLRNAVAVADPAQMA
jgi:hypothetical protein